MSEEKDYEEEQTRKWITGIVAIMFILMTGLMLISNLTSNHDSVSSKINMDSIQQIPMDDIIVVKPLYYFIDSVPISDTVQN